MVRLAQANEWAKLVDIYQREGQTDELTLISQHAKIEFPEIGTNRLIWFAEEKNMVIGAIQLVLISDQKYLANGIDRGMIHHLRVYRPFQDNGIGSLLNNVVEEEAKNRKFKELTLEVEKSNIKAKQIYKHWGYKYLCEGKDATEIVMIKEF